MPLTEQEENFLKFVKESFEYLKNIPPNLNITDVNFEKLYKKYSISPIKLIKFIQEIMKEEFEKGKLYGNIKMFDIEPLLEKKILSWRFYKYL